MPVPDWPTRVDPADPWQDDPPSEPPVAGPLPIRRWQPYPVRWIPDTRDIVRMATDVRPDIGNVAPDLLLGPLADVAAPTILAAAVAALAFVKLPHWDKSPFRTFSRNKPRPTEEVRACFRAVERAPLGAWEIAADGRVTDCIGLAPQWCPDRVDHPAGIWLARMVKLHDSWAVSTPFPVRELPDALDLWVRQEVARAKLRAPHAAVEDVLCQRGHAIVRKVHETSWLAGLC